MQGNPSLVVAKQNSLALETISKNGLQKRVHVVVKNQPFIVSLGLTSGSFNTEKLVVDAKLIYDCANSKEVAFVKLKPLECKPFPAETPDQLNLELKIKVLTSQLEDMLFRVKLSVVCGEPNQPISLTTYSEPIKVVSKPEQVKKTNKKQATITQPHPSTKKRDLNENLREVLSKIESNLDQTNASLGQFVQTEEVQLSTTSSVIENLTTQIQTLQDRVVVPQKEKQLSPFGLAFASFLDSFDKIPPELRASKIRKAARSAPKDTENFLNDIQEGMNEEKKVVEKTPFTLLSNSCEWLSKENGKKIPPIATFVPELYPSLLMMVPSADFQ